MTKSISIKHPWRISSSCVPKVYCLTPGGLVLCWELPTGCAEKHIIGGKKSAEAIVGNNAEGPNSLEWRVEL